MVQCNLLYLKRVGFNLKFYQIFIYIFIYIYNFISSLWCRGKARHWVPPLNTQCLQKSAEIGEQSVLTLGSLCLPCCVRDTAWSWVRSTVPWSYEKIKFLSQCNPKIRLYRKFLNLARESKPTGYLPWTHTLEICHAMFMPCDPGLEWDHPGTGGVVRGD